MIMMNIEFLSEIRIKEKISFPIKYSIINSVTSVDSVRNFSLTELTKDTEGKSK